MAQDAPASVDVTDIQFKVHDKFTVFNPTEKFRSHISLLATASNYGLMFVGNPNEAELKVIVLKDLVECKSNGKGLHARQVQLPNLPNCIAVSCDGSMLAVNYTQNGFGFVAVYSVPSFRTANIKSLHNVRLPGDDGVAALQLLWNPVIPGSLAVVMSNGSMGMYEFKNNSFEFNTIDAKEQICCGSWSPKGKQIVLGFPNGRLAQYKPDLKLARTIACPPNIHASPFKTIAVQWLSTFQFAVVFLQDGEDSAPSLYIVHAPKAGNPIYTNYYDICYSCTGLRAQQINLMHIQPWNLLLVTSANGVEVGLLGTKETSEAPTWVQYCLLDEARIEMPLTENKDETYPIGFALDTSSSHQLTIAERKVPVMPMIHVLTTHGQLVAFNFLNFQTENPDICSPPAPPSDVSGMSQFKPVNEMLMQKKPQFSLPSTNMPLNGGTQPPIVANAELSFAPTGTTSTSAIEKPKVIFGAPLAQMSTGSSMFSTPTSGFSFGASAAAPTVSSAPLQFSTSAAKTTSMPISFDQKQQSNEITTTNSLANSEKSKPLYTIPPTFTPPSVVTPSPAAQSQNGQLPERLPSINAGEVDAIINEMILFQINSFEMELKKMTNQNKGLLSNIGSTEEMKSYTKRLDDLQEIIDQANQREFESDLQCLRNTLNESYAMVAESRSKLNLYKNPDIAKLTSTSNYNPINRRQLAKLNSLLANNQAQLQIVHNQIDAQWSNFQDMVRRNSRTHMHTPCLEGIYQRMMKLRDMISRERTKLNFIKTKLKEEGLLTNTNQLNNTTKPDITMESLTDTILSMSIGPAVEESRSRLTKEKLNAIRELVRNRKITIIKPQRPDRVGLNSEVILESKVKSGRKTRDGAATNMDKMEQERIKTEQQRVLTKPTATKAFAPTSAPTISQPNAPATFGFAGLSPFVKPNTTKSEDQRRELQSQQPAIVKPIASTAAQVLHKPTPTTTAPTSVFSGFGIPSNSNVTFSGFSITPTTSVPAFTGFGTNASLTFGAPKPLIPNQSANAMSSVENSTKEQQPSLVPKTVASDIQPFSTLNFPSSFTAVSTPKTIEVTDKENKMPEAKPFVPLTVKSEAPPALASTAASAVSFGSTTISSSSGFSFGTSMTLSTQAKTTTSASTPFTFSFGSALGSLGDSTVSSSKPLFTGFVKPTPTTDKSEVTTEVAEKPASPKPTNESTGITLNLGTLGLPETPNMSPTHPATTAETNTSSAAGPVTDFIKTSSAPSADPTDNLFGNLNICKPTSADNNTSKPAFGGGNIFDGTSFATNTGSAPSTGFGIFAAASDATKSAFEPTSTGATVGSSISTTTTTSTAFSFASKTTPSFGSPATVPLNLSGSITTGQAPSTTSGSSLLAIPSTGSSIFASAAAAITTTTPVSSSTGSVFSGLSSSLQPKTSAFDTGAFSSANTAPTSGSTVQAAPTFFGAAVSSLPNTAPIGTSTFETATTSAAPVVPGFGAASTTSASSIFASAAAAIPVVSLNSGSIFSSVPKPEQPFFGQSEGNVFASANTDQSASGGNLFGGQTSTFGGQPNANTGATIFGGSTGMFAAAANNANNGGNIFSSPTPSSAGTNIFSTPTQSTAGAGSSIFDQSSATGQSGGPLFGGTGSQPAFGSSANIFQGLAGSTFGSLAPAQQPTFGDTNTSGFGLFSQQTPGFGSPSQQAGGSFAQGGTSVQQTGFGSPQPGTAFSKPVFGGAPTFGGGPTFGSPPSFGSPPAFTSPKGFGTFAAAPASGGTFSSPTQKSNLFEALGSSDTGLSFGNLAQNANANQQKPAFGGSSFMNYRS